MTEKLILNGIEFFVKRTERNSIGITVERNGSVTVHAPLKADLRAVERFISSKTLWIHQKLAYKKETNRGKVVRDFVSGQGFLYLGRSYRLRLVRDRIVTDKQNEALAPLNFRNGFFELLEKEKERAKDHFIQWYKKQTEKQLWARLPRYAQRIGVEVKDVKVLD
ncbi:MAG: M48 family metallopeptidase, partial [Syntrophales bacterium]|nr:M48 family metallopeptidase [Syntrophales bacterium]